MPRMPMPIEEFMENYPVRNRSSRIVTPILQELPPDSKLYQPPEQLVVMPVKHEHYNVTVIVTDGVEDLEDASWALTPQQHEDLVGRNSS